MSEKISSWLDIPVDSDFSMYNFPFGIFKTNDMNPRAASAIGDYVIDLYSLGMSGYFKGIINNIEVLNKSFLNEFISLGKPITNKVRERLIDLFKAGTSELRDNKEIHSKILFKKDEVELLLPVHVGDYTDFYSSIHHASNVGAMFRDPDNALLPNWKHLPVGYHGRASSIVVSGTKVKRPKGQIKTDEPNPIFTPTRLLDFELEMAFIIGKDSELGEPIPIEKAEDYIFGFVLFNDWSARDIQSWEYVPLGPFLSKNFLSSVSPWIVTLEALLPYRVSGPEQDPPVLPYLKTKGEKNFDIQLEVLLKPENGVDNIISVSNFKYMYWNICQQLAHHTVNGCNVKVGDMMASGTISGPDKNSLGCMLELTWRGTQPLKLSDNSERKFLLDGDTVTMRGFATRYGQRVGFGEVSGKVIP